MMQLPDQPDPPPTQPTLPVLPPTPSQPDEPPHPLSTSKTVPVFSLRSEFTAFLPLYALILTYVFFNMFVSGLIPGKGDCSLDQSPHTNFLESLLYAPLTHYKFSAKTSPQVVLVTMSEGSEPKSALENPCVGRQFLADLLEQLHAERARVIAVDKNFQSQACTSIGQLFDANLRMVLNDIGSSIPVILGQATNPRSGAKQEDDCLVQGDTYIDPKRAPDIPTGPSAPAGIYYGLTRLNSNALRIPLQWWVFATSADASNLNDPADLHTNGFALQAASKFDRHLLDREDLSRSLSESEHPYGTFAKNLNEIHAIDIVCRNKTRKDPPEIDWNCSHRIPSAEKPEDIDGKLVVIGQLSEKDTVPFPGGEQYGSRLQTDYISSLLEDSYVRRVPTWVDVAMLLILIGLPIGIDYLWPKSKKTPKWPHEFVAFLIAVGFLIILGALFLLIGKLFAPVAFLALYGGVTGLVGRGFDILIKRAKPGSSPSLPDIPAGAPR